MSERPIVRRLAELACEERDLPSEVVWEGQRRVLDTLACMIGGAGEPAVRQVRAGALAMQGAPEATIVGSTERTSADKAALANCAALRELDYMDGHYGPYPAHASFNIPPILAVAEQIGSRGRDVLRAIALAYEVQIRLQLAAGDPTINHHGWSPSTNLGVSAAVGIGLLLGLTADQMAHGIAISTTHAPALNAPSRGQMPGSTCCLDGMVAATAIQAVFLAQAGLTGPERVFEGEGGYRPAIARRLDESILLAPLDRYRVRDVYTMRFNGVKCAQTAAAAALEMAGSLPGGWRDVERLTLGFATPEYEHQHQDEAARRRPSSRLTAVHSAIYCVAAALVDGDLGPPQFGPDKLASPDVLSMVDRTVLEVRPELDRHYPACSPAAVTIESRDGRRLSKEQLFAPGHPRNPLSDEQLQAKFRRLTAGKLAASQTDDLLQQVFSLAAASSVRPLMALLAVVVP
jgi:2-methylcitrate dehydratase